MLVTGVNGWFPKINPLGEIVSGDTELWLTKAPWTRGSRIVAKGGGAHAWLGTWVVYNDLEGGTQVWPTGVGVGAAYNEIVAAPDGWAGFVQAGNGLVERWDREERRTESLLNACAPAMALGVFAYLTPYQGAERTLVLNGEPVASGIITKVCVGGGRVVYQLATGTYTRQIIDSRLGRVDLYDDEAPLVLFEGPGGVWLLSQTVNEGTLVRVVGSPLGYQITGDLHNPDARWVDGQLVVAGSSGRGELRIELFQGVGQIDLTNLRAAQPTPTPLPAPKPQPVPVPSPVPLPQPVPVPQPAPRPQPIPPPKETPKMFAYTDQATPATIGKLITVEGGYALLTDDHTALSVQPDGSYQSRPRANIGPWETATRMGDKLVYHHYDHGEAWIVFVVELP